jgi:hypothetical protein
MSLCVTSAQLRKVIPPMVTESDDGAVTRSTRLLIESMGALRPWERVTAESALALAKLIDLETDGSKAATLSRELRQLTGTLARVGERPAEASPELHDDADGLAVAADPIAVLVDEVARKRQERGA